MESPNKGVSPKWQKDTNEWTIELAQWCGVQTQDVETVEQLFPNIGQIALSSRVQALLDKVPSAKSGEEYMEKFKLVEQQLGEEVDGKLYLFARRLYDVCSQGKLETCVDDLLSDILELGEFFRPPLFYRQKPKLSFQFYDLALTSVPDYAIFRSIQGRPITTPEIAAIAIENKTRTEKPAVGQAIGAALACSMHNYLAYDTTLPIPVIRGRGVHLSFMNVSFSPQFLDTLQTGEIPFKEKATALLYPKRPAHGPHVGLNLLELEGRKKAFECLAILRRFVIQNVKADSEL